MAHYQVMWHSEDEHWNRDAHYVRVQLFRDGETLGVWLGLLDNLTRYTQVPEDDEVLTRFWHAAPIALANRLRDLGEQGKLPATWRIDAYELPLNVAEVNQIADNGSTDPGFWKRGQVILEFDA
jgi:hypothetical protein